MAKPDLSLIAKLVQEAATQIEVADKVYTADPKKKQEYIVELSKAVGLLSSVKMESDLLIADCNKLIKFSTYSTESLASPLDLLFPIEDKGKGNN